MNIIPTGLPWVHRHIGGGLKRGETLLIVGDQKSFKTSLGAAIAAHAAVAAGPVLVVTGGENSYHYAHRLRQVAPDGEVLARIGIISDRELVDRTIERTYTLIVIDNALNARDLLAQPVSADSPPMVVIAASMDELEEAAVAADHAITLWRSTAVVDALTAMLIKGNGQFVTATAWSDSRIWEEAWQPAGTVTPLVCRSIRMGSLNQLDRDARIAKIARLLQDTPEADDALVAQE